MQEKSKKIIQAPLPFMGQKRRFRTKIKEILENCPQDAVYVDLFGGSGLLSHTVKQHFVNSTVIYNDYDNYRERLNNIDKTNELLAEIRLILVGSPNDKKVLEPQKALILKKVLKAEKLNGYVDYITLSSNLLFSMKYVQSYEMLEKQTMYNCVRLTDYDKADDYLNGITVESTDYKVLFNKYKNLKNIVFLVDPPYLSTEVGTYKNHWKLKDYLDVLEVLKGTNYVYFTSNKTSIIELCEWMSTKPALYNPFEGSTTSTVNNQMNHNSSYTDIMMHRINYTFK